MATLGGTTGSDQEPSQHQAESSVKDALRLLEALPVPVFIAVDERIIFVNEAQARILGLQSAGDAVGQPLDRFVERGAGAAFYQALEEIASKPGSSKSSTNAWKRPDGRTLTIEYVVKSIPYQSSTAIQGVLRKVVVAEPPAKVQPPPAAKRGWFGRRARDEETDQAAAQAANIRETVQALDALPDGVYWTDPESICRYINRAGAEMLGYEPANLIGKRIHDQIHYRNDTGDLCTIETCPLHSSSSATRPDARNILLRGDGTPVPIRYSSASLPSGARIVTFRAAVSGDDADTSSATEEVRAAERLAAANAVRETTARERSAAEQHLTEALGQERRKHEQQLSEAIAAERKAAQARLEEALGRELAERQEAIAAAASERAAAKRAVKEAVATKRAATESAVRDAARVAAERATREAQATRAARDQDVQAALEAQRAESQKALEQAIAAERAARDDAVRQALEAERAGAAAAIQNAVEAEKARGEKAARQTIEDQKARAAAALQPAIEQERERAAAAIHEAVEEEREAAAERIRAAAEAERVRAETTVRQALDEARRVIARSNEEEAQRIEKTREEERQAAAQALKRAIDAERAASSQALSEARAAWQAEQSARRAEQTTDSSAALLDAIPQGIYALGMDGKITRVNQAAAEMLGWEPDKLVGKPAHDTIHYKRRDGSPYPLSDCPLHSGIGLGHRTEGDDEVFWTRKGMAFPIQYSYAPLHRGATLAGGVVSFDDVTERKLLGQETAQLDRMSTLGRFATSATHEFDRILQGIRSAAEVIRWHNTGEQLENAKQQLVRMLERGNHLVRQISRFTEPREGDAKPIEVVVWFQSFLQAARVALKENIELNFRLPDEPLYVKADPGQLNQIFMNLVLNARDAMPRGGRLTLSIDSCLSSSTFSFGVVPTPDRFIHFVVEDSGVGIPPELMSRIFEPLFTTKGSGTAGMGLAICHQTIHKLGGSIYVESTIGAGTQFHIFLPAAHPELEATAPESEELASAAPPIPPAPGPRRKRIVVLGTENLPDQELQAAKEAGVDVEVVYGGQEAASSIERDSPDALVMEISWMEADGVDVYKNIATRWPKLPIIVSTAKIHEVKVKGGLPSMPNVRYLPYDVPTLLRWVEGPRSSGS